eukprot:scaffold5558_cov162-Amphora_coffeaeformis.AAC.4
MLDGENKEEKRNGRWKSLVGTVGEDSRRRRNLRSRQNPSTTTSVTEIFIVTKNDASSLVTLLFTSNHFTSYFHKTNVRDRNFRALQYSWSYRTVW